MKRGIFLFIIILLSHYFVSAQTNVTYHRVLPGETLYRISVIYQIPVGAIKAANPTIQGFLIRPGDVIQIPGVSSGNAGEVPVSDTSYGQKSRDNSGTYSSTVLYQVDSQSGLVRLEAIKHIVRKGETLFSLSRVYQQDIQAIRNWNSINGNTIVEGQHIVVGWLTEDGNVLANFDTSNKTFYDVATKSVVTDISSLPPTSSASQPAAPVVKKAPAPPATTTQAKEQVVKNTNPESTVVASATPYNPVVDNSSEAGVRTAAISSGKNTSQAGMKRNKNARRVSTYERVYKRLNKDGRYKSVRSDGVAAIMDDNSMGSGNVLYVFHNSAPLHEIIKVTNPVNYKSVYLKVLGRFRGTAENDKVTMKIPKSVATKLGIRDSKPRLQATYHVKK